MPRECIKEAPSVDGAKVAIAEELGVGVEKIVFEVLQQPQKKTLGLFGGSSAIVKGIYQPSPISPSAIAMGYLKEILGSFGVSTFTVELESEDKDGCRISIAGDDVGFIIGRRGDTLDSLQYLTGLVANRGKGNYFRITIDINGYRKKREETLQNLAGKIASNASRTGRKSSLEPMNPYERRIIHTAVQEVKGAISWSVGVADRRHVVVGPSEDNPARRRPQQSKRRVPDVVRKPEVIKSTTARYDEDRAERPMRAFVPRNDPIHDVDGATPPSKTKSDKEESSTLYGRIDL